MKLTVAILSIMVSVATFSCKNESPEEVKLVTPEEMQTIIDLEDIQVVDIRTKEEHAGGYIENSQNIDFNSPTFEEDITKLDKSKPVLLYCNSGKRSAKCSKKLIDAGFEKVYELEGGITKWKFKGLDVIVN
ncbi:rhodanese-related sulfurtransferase [Flavobacteriaceae bacterium MAR_2010_72]|nr:rhodanese-related sulfurtransferase [Flavobacteriaceae bacterium MAR_2010_72]TVZ58977.1 rhodanese-related sulfurtransferase [Flavobacteriaceae bacterium MAR_2010_105]